MRQLQHRPRWSDDTRPWMYIYGCALLPRLSEPSAKKPPEISGKQITYWFIIPPADMTTRSKKWIHFYIWHTPIPKAYSARSENSKKYINEVKEKHDTNRNQSSDYWNWKTVFKRNDLRWLRCFIQRSRRFRYHAPLSIHLWLKTGARMDKQKSWKIPYFRLRAMGGMSQIDGRDNRGLRADYTEYRRKIFPWDRLSHTRQGSGQRIRQGGSNGCSQLGI